jgi:anthranilate synthase component 2
MILLIDNYDSFTHNLVHLAGGLDRQVLVKRNDALTAREAVNAGAEAILLSPGPCTPNEAGICLALVTAAAEKGVPVFGVCLGMQAIAQATGGTVGRAGKLMHGKTCNVVHEGKSIFKGLPSPFIQARYHSLSVKREGLPEDLAITATADDDNEIMAIAHKKFPIVGVQFHPESIASEYGAQLLSNFLTQAAAWAH